MEKTFADFGIIIPSGRHGNIKLRCPQCSEQRHDKRDKSLSVNLDKGLWHCHYCGWSGSLSSPDPDDEDAKRRWMEQQPWYRKPRPKSYAKPAPATFSPFSDALKAYMRKRGISERTMIEMRVSEGREMIYSQGREYNCVKFNYYLDGELVNVKSRTGDKHFQLVRGARSIPYNIDSVLGKPVCVICEGEMDALSFHEVGWKSVVSVPNGANANLSWLDDFMESHFDDKEKVYVAADSDAKGQILRDELLRRFGPERCLIVTYGDGCKDANDCLQKYGAAHLKQRMAEAEEPKVEGVFTVRDFEDSLDQIWRHGLQPGLGIGHKNFDDLCTFETKRLCVVTGIPGSGKSEFIDEIAERMNIRHGWRFAYFSPENAPLAYHASKLIEKFTGRRFSDVLLPAAEYAQVKERLEDDFSFICPKDDFTLGKILECGRFLVRRRGVNCLVIDPYNRLTDESDGKNETQYISKMLDRLMNFAQQNNVLVILMAHPRKLAKEDGVIKPPTLYEIGGSAHFYNKCDYGIVVHRERQATPEGGTRFTDEVRVLVEKVRFRHLGHNGVARFTFNTYNGRYTPIIEGVNSQPDNTNHLAEHWSQPADDPLGHAEEVCPF